MIQRYFITIAYDGEKYHGWQRQPNQISIQEVIEDRLTKLNSNIEVKVIGCGRTDTGVHAKHFILHTDLPKIKNITSFIFKLNIMLPESISVSKISPVDSTYHARFDAISRTYKYFIHKEKDPFKNRASWLLKNNLDFNKMNEAAKFLIGEKDFTSLSKINTDVKTNICNVIEARWIELDEQSCYFEITANRFLRNMVRATVGSLIEIGLNKNKPEYIKDVLNAMNRQASSASVPAKGLFLWNVEYTKEIKI